MRLLASGHVRVLAVHMPRTEEVRADSKQPLLLEALQV